MATTGATLHLVALLQICKSGRLPSPPAVALMRRSSTPSSSSSSFRTFPHEKKKRKEKKTTRKEIPKTISLTLLGFSIEIIRYAKRPDLQGPNPRRTCGFRCSFVSFLVFSSSFFLFWPSFFFLDRIVAGNGKTTPLAPLPPRYLISAADKKKEDKKILGQWIETIQ